MSETSQNSTMDGGTTFNTLAFIDLETTGLPQLEFNRTKITQLSILACSAEHIKELSSKHDIPRVTYKLTLCFNPYKLIKLNVMEITGLSNELLEHERKFDENAADLIITFLNHLQQPVLLVAHNGARFDYPILKKHFNALNKSLPESVKCCDSLEIFRKIDEIYEQNSKILINGFRLTSWEKIKDETLEMIEAEIVEVESIFANYNGSDSDDCSEGTISKLEEKYLSMVPENELKEKHEEDEMKARQILNETTPNKPTKSKNKMPPSKGSEKEERKVSANVNRELFPQKPSTSTFKKWPKGKYKLTEIYRRIFDELPENSHDAEGDVKALLKCVIAYKKEFLEVAQSMSSNFCDVKEL
jgi:three prime repair exonuclease-1